MASSQDENEEWDSSTSEIESKDSHELYESRPNRWRGPPQSWRAITEEDRLTYNALQRLRDQDLSVHLYNAFSLRQTSQEAHGHDVHAAEEEDIDAETGLPVRKRPWAPPKSWTAWPLRRQLVPPDDFMKRTEDEDEVLTLRRLEREAPSSRLGEVVSASILKFAKDKFRKRDLGEPPSEAAAVRANKTPISSENEPLPSEAESEGEGKTGRDTALEGESKRDRDRSSQRTFKPTIATNDDVSYELIRPSTRQILDRLDRTLTILHNVRMTSAQNLMDRDESPSEDEDHDDEEADRRKPRSRRSSRATTERAHSRSISRMSTGDETHPPESKKSNRGRKPKTQVARPGESERDFLVRRAKEQKKKIPLFLDDDDQAATIATESRKSPRRRRRKTTRQREGTMDGVGYWMQKKLDRFNLRDWSDVMGAAALAGFSPKVIARATQRCANLFDEGMDMHTIAETAASSGGTGIQTTSYRPGQPSPSSSSEGEDEGDDLDIRQARSMSRHSSVAPSKVASPALADNEDSEGRESSRKRQKRSISRGAQHYCPHASCSRALKGFDRPYNLKRHLKLVHGQETVDQVESKEASEDVLDGGIHRDGFLEPIRVRKGWRAEDVRKRPRQKTARKRQRSESSGEDEESESEDGSSTKPESDS